MRPDMQLSTGAVIGDDCPMTFSVNQGGEVEVLFGGQFDGFSLVCSASALDRLLSLGADAAAQARQAPENGRGPRGDVPRGPLGSAPGQSSPR
jgi:hypothetical protein